jgi:CRP-like cAMP-binding protein
MLKVDNRKYLSEIKKILFFKFLSDAEEKDILENSEIYSYNDGEKIINEGDVQPYIFAVIKGSVDVLTKSEGEHEVFICSIEEGDVFGEAGIFLHMKRMADVVSRDEVVLLRIHRDDILKFIKKNPIAGNKMFMLIIHSLLKKLKEANQEISVEKGSRIDQEDIDSIMKDLSY